VNFKHDDKLTINKVIKSTYLNPDRNSYLEKKKNKKLFSEQDNQEDLARKIRTAMPSQLE